MKNILFILFYFLMCTMLLAQEIPVYDCQEFIIFQIGSSEGEVGYKKNYGATGGFAGPTFYTFSPNGNFYICDFRNSRINVYNSSFDFIKTINPDTKIANEIFIWVTIDEKDNLTCILDLKGLYKLNNIGQIVFFIPIETLSKSVKKKYNFFNVDENLLLYDPNGITDKLILLDNKGLKLAKEKVDTFIHDRTLEANNLLKIKNENEKKLEAILNENNLIIYNNKLLTTDFKQHRKYFHSLKEINNLSNSEKIKDIKDESIFVRIRSARFKGFDAQGYSYWSCTDMQDYRKHFIVILSNKGELLDYFTTDLIKEAFLTVSLEGDIFFIKTNEEGCKIYKTIRQ